MSRSKRVARRNKKRDAPLSMPMSPASLNAEPPSSSSVAMAYSQMTMYAGPYPPPEMVRQYNDASPGLGNRLMDLLQEQSRHRMALEKQVIAGDISRSWWGLGAAFVIAISFLCGGVYVVKLGHPTAGATIATATVVGLVATFITGTASRRAERIEKSKAVPGKRQ